jgi:hypothetical protein
MAWRPYPPGRECHCILILLPIEVYNAYNWDHIKPNRLTDEEKRRAVMMTGERVGEVTHFFGKINVAVVKLKKELKVGDRIHFLGSHTDFQQELTSMQVEHESISVGEAGSEVAIKTTQRVRRGDKVFLLPSEE